MTQIFGMLWLFLVISVGLQGWSFTLSMWDPFFYHSVTVISPKVKRGGVFIEELDVQRYRICKVEIDRFLLDDATRNVIYRERVAGGATSIGRNIARNMVPVPIDAPLGPVTLLQNVHSQCIDGMHSMQWPVMHFEVIE
jgi:hypothetical protein